MATLILDNLPDELLAQINKLAQQKNNSVHKQTIDLLKIALGTTEKPVKIMVNPDSRSHLGRKTQKYSPNS